jgi:cytochrome c-type biogenesis protein CcmH/NrfG
MTFKKPQSQLMAREAHASATVRALHALRNLAAPTSAIRTLSALRARLAMLCVASALAFAGCAQIATSVVLNALPELLASTLGQYNFRSEFAEARPLIQARDWLGLSTLARRKIDVQPDRGEWWQLAGYGHMQMGEFAVARDAFARMTKLIPEEVNGWNLYAFTLQQTGQQREAFAALDKAVQIDPTNGTSWVLYGDMHARAGRSRDASTAYERALQISNRDIFAWYGLGQLGKRSGDAAMLARASDALKKLSPPLAAELAK